MPVDHHLHAEALRSPGLVESSLEVNGFHARLFDQGLHSSYDSRIVLDDSLHRLEVVLLNLEFTDKYIAAW